MACKDDDEPRAPLTGNNDAAAAAVDDEDEDEEEAVDKDERYWVGGDIRAFFGHCNSRRSVVRD